MREKLKELRKSAWFRRLLPLIAVVAATLLHFLTAAVVGLKSDFPFAFYYLIAVFATAWVGGPIPGVIACILTMIGLPLALDRGFHLKKVDLVRLTIFIGVSLLVSAVAEAQRRIQKKLREANEELDRRVAERTGELADTVTLLRSEVEERTRTEVALRSSEQRVDLTLDAAGIGRWDLDLLTGAIARSEGHDRIFGYDSLLPEWTTDTFLNHVHADDRAASREFLRKAAEGGEFKDYDVRIIRADGEMRWIWLHGKVLFDARGKPINMLGSVHDITSRKLAEERLKIQLQRLNLLDHITRGIGERQDLRSIFQVVIRSLEDNLPIDFGCICLCDAAGAFLHVTCVGVHGEELSREIAMTEYSTFPVDQSGLSRCVRGQLLYEPDVARMDSPFSKRLARGGVASMVAAPLLVANETFGLVIAARKTVSGFSSNDCEFLRQLSEHVALATHQARIREALQKAYDDLHKSQQTVLQQERLRALGQMASGIAHDINNAVSPVTLYTESLLETEPNLSPRARGYLETIHRAIDDVAQTVSRMREFYRQQEPQLVLSPIDVGTLGRQVLDLTAPHWSDLAQRRGATIRAVAELVPDLPAVMGIESEIREALTNLVLNAVDAMPNGGELTIRTRIATGLDGAPRVHVEVSDTGVGMDEDTRRRCLEPFFTTKGERGTGLGLAMVYGTAQRHNAQVEIDSAPGTGTTTRLVFPVPETAEAAIEQEVRAPSVRSLRILVVDDDPLLIRSLCDTLQIDGHDVVTADGGDAGIETFRKDFLTGGSSFALVITDLGMPYTDGRKVATAIKAMSPTTPVILLTGWGQRLIEEGDAPANVDRVLSKPPRLRDLRAALTYCIELRTAMLAGHDPVPVGGD